MLSSRNVLGFSMTRNMGRVMEIDNFYASIMRSEKKNDDSDSSLPPGIPIPVLPVDYLVNRPNFWVGGRGSYVCPIESDWALWFNWTMNNTDMSILTSVKGMNPITGQRVSGLQLEQYKEYCPIHKVKFLHGRLCPECNFKWPEQNYIADPMPFYWDGFRSSDGIVRQFYFTEEMSKSIPELVIGKEDTVPAFGFCFYKLKHCRTNYEGGKRLKNKFPKVDRVVVRRSSGRTDMTGIMRVKGVLGVIDSSAVSSTSEDIPKCAGATVCYTASAFTPPASTLSERSLSTDTKFFSPDLCSKSLFVRHRKDYESVKSVHRYEDAAVGVGAGGKIDQGVIGDSRSIDEWNDKPAGILRIYFVFREQFERYVEDGLKDLSGFANGYLENLPVGGAR